LGAAEGGEGFREREAAEAARAFLAGLQDGAGFGDLFLFGREEGCGVGGVGEAEEEGGCEEESGEAFDEEEEAPVGDGGVARCNAICESAWCVLDPLTVSRCGSWQPSVSTRNRARTD